MLEAFSAVIYSALLSSGTSTTGTCTSSRSAARVIVRCMRGGHHASCQRRARDARSQQARSLFTPGENLPCRGDVKNLRTSDFSRWPHVPIFSNKHYLSQSPLLRLANPRSLPIRYDPVASIHSNTHPADSQPSHTWKSPEETILAIRQISGLERFRSCMISLSEEHGDLERAWASFEALRTSDDLSRLPEQDVMRFAVSVYEASLLSLHEPRALSREDAVRLGRLHDELQGRIEGSVADRSTLQTWSNTLAVQTLILVGKVDKALQMITETLVASKGQVSPQQTILVQQLFLATTRQCSLAAGLAVLARTWFWIRGHFHMHLSGQDVEIGAAAETLRQTVLFAFGTADEAGAFLQTIEDTAVQEVGTSIFAFVYGMQQSAESVHAVYRNFVSRGLSMPLEAHLRFFTALLSKGAYTPAYVIRKHIHSRFPGKQAERETVAALRSFPGLAEPGPAGQDALSSKVTSAAMARFVSCIEGPPLPQEDVLSIWEDVEASDILSRGDGPSGMYVIDDNVLAFGRVIVESSRATLGDKHTPNAKAFAYILDHVVEELSCRYSKRCRGRDVENPFTVPLRWHALTLKGDLHTVGDLLVRDRRRQKYPLHVRAITQLFLVALQLQTLREAFLYLVPLWHVVVQHLDDASTRYSGEMGRESTELRKSIFTVFGNIEDPGEWIASVPGTSAAQNVAGHLFFTLFREQGDSNRALDVFDDLQARGLPVSYEAYLVLLKTFLRGREYEVASRVYTSLQSRFPERTQTPQLREKDELHTALRLFSLRGDVRQAQECFDVMVSRGFVDGGARRRLLRAYAENGNTERVHQLFDRFFPVDSWSLPRPCVQDYREVIYAHVRAGDLVGINRCLDEMVKANILPDLSIYNMILLAFATSSDLESASAVLSRMYENDVKPDRISYTTVISIMADRKDPISAEQLYQRALDDGVEPDDVMTMALMNAHVEAGSWKGVIRAFDYLHQSGGRSKRRTTQLYNTLLKAYVLIGAPFRVVSDIFARFESLSLEPTEYSYALLIQSACDSGRMDIASDLFIELDTTVLHGQTKSLVNAYVMTIIMAGFLRAGNKEKAKAVYDDMYGRGIQPTSVTFGIIVQSYANERSEESLRIAEDFMHSLLSAEESQRAWIGSARGGRPKALESVFGPLMAISGRQLDVAAVERQFDEMLAAGGQPTLVALTMLMDAYRRVDNIGGVQQIWHEIVDVALRISKSDVFERLPSPSPSLQQPRPQGGPQRQANILCLSLSVYIDALSAAGRHIEIATTWRQVRDWGFAFDAHNWNHLAVALVRAGEVERAFEIVERVLVPYQIQTRSFVRARRRDPQTPLTYVRPAGEPADEAAVQSPARHPSRRVHAARSATRLQDGLSPLNDVESDPAQPLHELQQLSLTWQAWRTHNVTLDVLSAAVKQLEAGVRVRPTKEALREDEDPRRMSASEASEFYARERQEVGEMLRRIYQNYPNAVRLVERREGVV